MHTSGFNHAPISKYLVLYIVASALIVTATDTKHYFILPTSIRHPQWLWRALMCGLVYTNSTEVLFAGLTVYQCRIVERAWGSRKLGSFILSTLPYTTLLPPLLLILLRPLTFSAISYLPAGPTAVLFAVLAQYHAAIPYSYRYNVGASSSMASTTTPTTTTNNAAAPPSTNTTPKQISLTSKSTAYLPALQLALSQLPGSLIPALVGWAVGYAWRLDLLPWPRSTWRVPGWAYGRKTSVARGGGREGVEGLRMRLERESGGEARASEGGASGRRGA